MFTTVLIHTALQPGVNDRPAHENRFNGFCPRE